MFPRTGHVFMGSLDLRRSFFMVQGLKIKETEGVLALEWLAQSQDLCWGDTS